MKSILTSLLVVTALSGVAVSAQAANTFQFDVQDPNATFVIEQAGGDNNAISGSVFGIGNQFGISQLGSSNSTQVSVGAAGAPIDRSNITALSHGTANQVIIDVQQTSYASNGNSDNTVAASVIGDNNYLASKAQGSGNSVAATIIGNGNRVTVPNFTNGDNVWGRANTESIFVNGSYNKVEDVLAGRNSSNNLTVEGDNNTLKTMSDGLRNRLDAAQLGNTNVASLRAQGIDSVFSVRQWGSKNTTPILIGGGIRNRVHSSVQGDNNYARVSLTYGNDNSVQQYSAGIGNNVDLALLNSSHENRLWVNQYGTSNNITGRVNTRGGFNGLDNTLVVYQSGSSNEIDALINGQNNYLRSGQNGRESSMETVQYKPQSLMAS